jgi:hypothetical protein
MLIAGTLPGVIAGSAVRVRLLPGPQVFDLVVAVVLLPLGIWLVLTRPAPPRHPGRRVRLIPVVVLIVLAAIVGCVDGIYGIGGGSILSPILIGSGRRASEVAPAALASTFVTSVAGVDHLHDFVRASSWLGGAELAHRDRAGYRRPGRRLHRCPDPVPATRRPDPPPGRRPGHRHRRPLPIARAGITGPVTQSAGESITQLATHHAGKRQRPLD